MAVQIGSASANTIQIALTKSDETFSSRLVNYVEGTLVGGVAKTKIFTKVNTNLKVGDKVFIINGNYCNAKLNKEYIYNEYSSGYKILEIDRCAIIIDLDFQNIFPKNEADFNDEELYIKTYVVNNLRDVDYDGYLMNNDKNESLNRPKYEYTSPVLKDIIYNNTGSSLTSPFGSIANNTFYSYTLNLGQWVRIPLADALLKTLIKPIVGTEKRLYIMQTFTGGGGMVQNDIAFEKGKVYQLVDDFLQLDITYEDAFISKSNFRFGNFKGGSWNDGIFGKKTNNIFEKKTYWEGATWKNGILYNSDWLTGTMESKSDNITQQSYYGELDEFGLIKQTTDFTNNKSFGYNFIYESNVEKATIKNANVFGCIFGSMSSSNSVRDEYYLSGTNSSDITISNGLYYDCDFGYVNISSGTFEISDISNSNVKNAKILDTNINKSIIDKSEYDSIGSVKILDYDKQYYRIDDAGVKRIAITHKFYISDLDFLKIEEGDSVYFNNFISNHLGVDTLFDREYFIGVGENANTNGFNHGYLYDNHEVILDLRPKSKNAIKYIIDSGTTSFNVVTASNDKFYNSLDLTFIVAPVQPSISGTYSISIGDNNYDYIYNNLILTNENYKSKIVVFDAGKIQISKLSKSLVNNSTWTRGSREIEQDFVIKPNPTLFTPQYPIMSITGSYGSYELSINLDYSNNRDLWLNENLDIDEVVYLNNITYNEGTQSYDLSGVYSVSTYSYGTSSRVVQLADYGDSIINIGVTFSLGGIYSYRNVPFKAGSVSDLFIDNSVIKGGLFRRMSFNNTKISSDTLNTTDELLLKANINSLRVLRSFLSEEDNLTLENSFITESALKGATVTNALVFNSIGYNMVWNDGLFYGSYWDNGVFNNGKFNGLASVGVGVLTIKELDNSSEWYSSYAIYSGFAVWKDGTFNNGEFVSSYWVNGIFNNGLFNKGLWGNGEFNNGEFGRKTLSNSDTQFWSGTWSNGIFTKGIFGNRQTTAFPTYSDWYGGEFRDGIFAGATHSGTGAPIGNTTWYDGIFNGGEFSGSARWKDGIFNGGKFKSFYGSGTGSSASNYSWEYGTFNNGEFGDTTYASSNTWNSTWYDGTFEGGIFQGRVWNNGVFTGGRFQGMTANGASSSNHILNQPMNAVSHPENFVLSYSSEVSTKNWYGLWRDGIVIDNLEDLSNKSDRRFKAIRLFKGEKKPTIIFENVLWVNGTFSSTSAQMNNSVWLDGQFNRGEFISSSFNPYVPRWDFSFDGGASVSSNNGFYQHSLTSSCVWNNGTLNNSDFYISTWNNGRFLYGTMSNAEFNNGVSNYMNAYNVIWNNGRWRNGNWYGANISCIEELNINGSGGPGVVYWYGKYSKGNDGVVHQMRRHNNTHAFMWNVFGDDAEYSTTATASLQPLNNDYYNLDQPGNLLINPPGNYVLASNVEFDGYQSFGYGTPDLIVLAEYPGSPVTLTASLAIEGFQVETKFGNGAFKRGIWENGVWNNGPRDVFWQNTEETKYFDKVTYYQLSRDIWQIVLTGSDQNSDISNFTVGDDISIGNIVLIDINGDRKLIKDKFKIVNLDEDLNYLYVNAKINFPIRKIEIDSSKHKISVTKNIWLSGLFLNGKFNGVWNNGFFKGYPCITEMIRSNWIDGTFDGGHFLADIATYSDSISGTMAFGTYSTGLIQNAKIYTNIENPSKTAPSITNRFDTYMDLNYTGEPGGLLEAEELRTTSINFNLVGSGGADNPYVSGSPITYDVLSSVTNTIFNPNVYYNLKLGSKFEEYDNILTNGISSLVDVQSPNRLEDIGWSFSVDSGGFLKLPGGSPLSPSQTVFLASDNDFSEPVANGDTGYPLNEMNIEPQGADKYFIYHNNQVNINKLRYTRIDVDILPLYATNPTDGYMIPWPSFGSLAGPFYMNLAYNKQDTFKMSSFFFNRPINDPLYVVGGDPGFGLRVDNTNYIELDMIPFFDYGNVSLNDNYINCDPRVPYEATAPFIDYDDTDFSFIDNVSFEFNSSAVVPPTPVPPVLIIERGSGGE